MICSNNKCGIIFKDIIDQSAEWRFYGADDNHNSDPTRCGMPINPLLKESSCSCKVLCGTKSSYEMHKIRRYTDWQSMPYKEKSRYDEFQLIINISQNAGIPKIIIDEAMRIHKKISETKTFRGLNRDGIIAASIYIASRLHNYPRTAKEIATIFNLDNTSTTKGCKNALTIMNELDIANNYIATKKINNLYDEVKNNNNGDIDNYHNNNSYNDNGYNDTSHNDTNHNDTGHNNYDKNNGPNNGANNLDTNFALNISTPISFIERFCSKLNINSELTNLCKFIANKIESQNIIPENTPHSIAGGIIYFVSQECNLNISKYTINNISKISEVTINKCYKKLINYKHELLPDVIIKKYCN